MFWQMWMPRYTPAICLAVIKKSVGAGKDRDRRGGVYPRPSNDTAVFYRNNTAVQYTQYTAVQMEGPGQATAPTTRPS
jgi:hypothetical protein